MPCQLLAKSVETVVISLLVSSQHRHSMYVYGTRHVLQGCCYMKWACLLTHIQKKELLGGYGLCWLCDSHIQCQSCSHHASSNLQMALMGK